MAGKYNLSVGSVLKKCIPFIVSAIIGILIITFLEPLSTILLK